MFLNYICVVLFIASVSATGELTILHHPKSLLFKGHDHVKESILKEVYSAALGFSTEQHSNWNGLFIEDPFDLAEAVVTVSVDGVPEIGNGKGHHFPLKTDDDELNVYTSLENRVLQRYPESNSHLIRINLDDGLQQVNSYEIFQKVKNNKPIQPTNNILKLSIDEDRAFLTEIALLNSIIDVLEQGIVQTDNVPDIFWFKITSLHALRDLHGENSTELQQAKQILNNAINHLNHVFNKVYHGKVLVSVISSDAIHTRRTRNILADEEADPNKGINPAKKYSKDYPVIFNIILWFGVAMTFSLLAVCIFIAQMDPGRDSIIYRMTSTRLKKDN